MKCLKKPTVVQCIKAFAAMCHSFDTWQGSVFTSHPGCHGKKSENQPDRSGNMMVSPEKCVSRPNFIYLQG